MEKGSRGTLKASRFFSIRVSDIRTNRDSREKVCYFANRPGDHVSAPHPEELVSLMSTGVDWLEINSRFRIPLSEFEFAFVRSSGPGGQNVNKVSSKAQLRWRPHDSASIPEDLRYRVLSRLEPQLTVDKDLLVVSQLYRDQPRNREDCLQKLKAILEKTLVVAKTRKKSKPTRASNARRLKAKKLSSEKKSQRRLPTSED